MIELVATSRRAQVTVVVAVLLAVSPTTGWAQSDTTQAIPPSRSARPVEYQIGDALTLSGEVAFRLEYFRNEFFAENDATVDDDHRFRERVRLRFGVEFAPMDLLVADFASVPVRPTIRRPAGVRSAISSDATPCFWTVCTSI